MNDSVVVSERALMRLTLELASWMEAADAESFDADMAMKWLEEVSAVFGDLPEDAQRRLLAVAGELAAEYRDDGWTDAADFFDASAKNFGLGPRER